MSLCSSTKYQEQNVLPGISTVHFGETEKSSWPLQPSHFQDPVRTLSLALPELGQGTLKLTVYFSEIQLQVTLATILSDLAFFFGSLE